MTFDMNEKEAQLNFEVATILYKNTPLMPSKLVECVALFLTFLVGFFNIQFFVNYISSNIFLNIAFALVIVMILPFLFLRFLLIYDWFGLKDYTQPLKDKHFEKMLFQIKQRGLGEHFLHSDLFMEISNPSRPILYLDVERVYKKALKEMKSQNKLANAKESNNFLTDI